jgi:membrane protein required for colicin V production
MQPYDIGMMIVLVAATVFGAYKGMAWQLASMGSLLASYFASLRFSETLAPYFSAEAPWNRFLAMLVIYLVTSLAIWLAFRVVSGAIERVKLREFDRQIGGLFGAAKGVLWCVVITFFAVTLSNRARETVLKSRSGYYIAALLHEATPVMPRELHQLLGPYLEQFNRQLDPRTSTRPSA